MKGGNELGNIRTKEKEAKKYERKRREQIHNSKKGKERIELN
jgi:hypothetical protein